MVRPDNFSNRQLITELDRGHRLLTTGAYDECGRLARQLVRQHPDNPHTWHLLSSATLSAGDASTAIDCAERALALLPNEPAYLLQLGQCLVRLGRRNEALHVAQRLGSLRLDRADWNDALGTLFTYCEDPSRALPFFERAVKLSPQNGPYLYNLATAQRMTGDLSLSEATLDEVIRLQPNDVEAHYLRSHLQTQTTETNHIEALEFLLRNDRWAVKDRVMLYFTLAKELEDVRRYADSFEHLKRGADLRRQFMKYDVTEDVVAIDELIRVFDGSAVNVGGGLDTEECIFIIGLPRSGTTLVERIIASHSMVQAAGELQSFPMEAMKAVQRLTGKPVGMRDIFRHSLMIDPAELGGAYLRAARPRTGSKPYFIDKLPLNYLYAGLIRRALPRARIVALARDPMDSCYALYKTLFVGAYPFSYDLSDLGNYYASWHRLMCHWRSVMGDDLLVVSYEALVANQEKVSRRIIEHCRLDWEDACLAFQDLEYASTTASAAQVRRPLYSSSVGNWRHFEQELRPLADALNRHEPEGGWSLALCG